MTTSPVIQVVGILGGIRIVRRTTWGTRLLVWGSLVFSVAESFFGVTAIVLGLQAQAAADRGEATNRGAGTAGIVLGIIGFCATLIYLFVQMRGSGV